MLGSSLSVTERLGRKALFNGATVALDFTRGRYRAPTTNLIPNSNAPIASSGASLVSTTVDAPDGTLTASRFNLTNASLPNDVVRFEGPIAPSQTYSGSLWVRGIAGQSARLYTKRTNSTTSASGPFTTITFTGEWQRVTGLIFTAAADNTLGGVVVNLNTTLTATQVDVWGAQLEPHGGQSGPYVATSGAPITASPLSGSVDLARLSGLTFSRASVGYAEQPDGTLVQFAANQPRITGKGLLVEEARTNLVLSAGDGTNLTYWAPQSLSQAVDLGLASYGAFRRVELKGNGQNWHRLGTLGGPGVTSGTTYSVQFWMEPGSSGKYRVEMRSTNGTDGSVITGNFSADNGAPVLGSMAAGGIANASIRQTPVGYYVLSFQWTPNFTGNANASGLGPNSVVVGESVVFLGMQVEQGAFPTSFIPTTTAAATRAADRFVVFGSLLPAQFSVLAVQGSIPNVVGVAGDFPRVFSFNDGDGTDQIDVYRRTTSQGLVEVSPAAASVTTAYSAAPPKSQTFGRVAVAVSYDGATVKVSANGSNPVGGGASVPVSVINRLDIANRAAGDRLANGYFEHIALYSRVLSDAELQAATS